MLLVPNLTEEELDQVGYYGEYYSPHPMEVLILTHPPLRGTDKWAKGKGCTGQVPEVAPVPGAKIIEEWLRSSDPFIHGVVYPLLGIPRTAAASSHVVSSWESHFLEGRGSRIAHCTGRLDYYR